MLLTSRVTGAGTLGCAGRAHGPSSAPTSATSAATVMRQQDPRYDRPRGSRCNRRRGSGRGSSAGRRCRADSFERHSRLADVAQSLARLAFKAALEERPDGAWRAGRERRQVDRLPQDGRHRVGDVLALEQPAAGQHLVADDAKSPDVGPAIDGLAARLLGRHVGGGPEDRAELGRARRDRRRVERVATDAGRGVECLGQPEVQHLHRAIVDIDRREPTIESGRHSPAAARSRAPSA